MCFGIKKCLYLHSQNGFSPVERFSNNAEIAQLVEHNLAKVGVASSSLVFRSKSMKDSYLAVFFCFVFSVIMARTSDPNMPPSRGLGGVNNSSREICLRVARARVSFSALAHEG